MPFWLFIALFALLIAAFIFALSRKAPSTSAQKLQAATPSTIQKDDAATKEEEENDIVVNEEEEEESEAEKQLRLEAAARVKDATVRAIRKKQQQTQQGNHNNRDVKGGGVPPGQKVSKRWVVLDIAGVRKPNISPESWRLTIDGEVENPIVLNYRTLVDLAEQQPKQETSFTTAMHCVTGWTTLGLNLEGVLLKKVLELVKPKSSWKYLEQVGIEGYTTNLPRGYLEEHLDSIYLVYGYNGGPLPVEHGGPVRVMVNGLYGYKSAKWVTQLSFTIADPGGTGEARGYHPVGDIWKEERLIEVDVKEEKEEKETKEAKDKDDKDKILALIKECEEEQQETLKLNGLRLGKENPILPEAIYSLTQLDALWLNSMGLSFLPKEFFVSFRNLNGLSIQNNQLTTLPPEIGQLKYLGELWANNNQIEEIPDSLFDNCRELVVVALDNNRISYLSPSVSNLTDLKALMLDNNQLNAIPKELAQCEKLNLLQVRGNRFTEIPTELSALQGLEWFGLDDGVNGISDEIMSEGAAAILDYLNKQAKNK